MNLTIEVKVTSENHPLGYPLGYVFKTKYQTIAQCWTALKEYTNLCSSLIEDGHETAKIV